MRATFLVSLIALTVFICAPARATVWLIPPVDAPISARFDAPAETWGPGHRGIDYAVEEGTAVRSAADGTVVFAGNVAGTFAVTIAHSQGMETTYSALSEVSVAAGDVIEQGYWIGRAGRAHADAGGLHFGVKVEGHYADPEAFLGPLDTSLAIRLAPLVWEPPGWLPALFREPFLSARSPATCEPAPAQAGGPPNDNIAVLVAGIGSRTAGGISAALYESGGSSLGYSDEDTYEFSYRGSSGPRLHEPYDRGDTFGDIASAAARLRTLLVRIARRHPGRAIDLVAHSQGGIVARSFLQLSGHAWDRDLPPVEHLVTFSSPHGGAPLSEAVPALEASAAGSALLKAASWWSRHSGPLPDPYATSVGQLAPGSGLLTRLDREAVLYGTRVLSLGIPNDVVVPADRARWDRYASHVVGPAGLNGHEAVVTSEAAHAVARRFLRDGPATCRTGWDLWGPRLGRAFGSLERAVPALLGP